MQDGASAHQLTDRLRVSARVARVRLAQLAGHDVTNEARNTMRSRLLAQHIPPGGVGAEIGVHQGYLSRHLLDRLQPRRLHLMDPWYLGGAEWSWGSGDRSTARALARIIRRYEADLVSGRVVLGIGFDLDLLAAMADASLDWAYLDTTHAEEQTWAELQLLRRKVKPDGFITGDDWRSDPSHRHHGVAKSVRRFVAEHRYEVLHASDDDQQWIIRAASG